MIACKDCKWCKVPEYKFMGKSLWEVVSCINPTVNKENGKHWLFNSYEGRFEYNDPMFCKFVNKKGVCEHFEKGEAQV